MPSTHLTFADRASHRAWLAAQSALPAGFRVGSAQFDFTPAEVRKPARMTLTLIALDRPTADFAAVFTRNAFPGAPVLVGRARLDGPSLGAIRHRACDVPARQRVPRRAKTPQLRLLRPAHHRRLVLVGVRAGHHRRRVRPGT